MCSSNKFCLYTSDNNKYKYKQQEQKKIFHFFLLSHFDFISAPTIFIVDEQGIPLLDKYYEVDSTIQLTCIVRHISMMSSVVFWIHNNNSILNYDVTRGGIRFVFLVADNSMYLCVMDGNLIKKLFINNSVENWNFVMIACCFSETISLWTTHTELFWSVTNKVLISISLNFSVRTDLMEIGANSTLLVAKVNTTDAGNYTCSIGESQQYTVLVHVLNGKIQFACWLVFML